VTSALRITSAPALLLDVLLGLLARNRVEPQELAQRVGEAR
jgi:hypothetical protein